MAPDQQPVRAVRLSPMLVDIKNAVRELRARVPDSALVDLAEQKIARIERRQDMDEDHGKRGR